MRRGLFLFVVMAMPTLLWQLTCSRALSACEQERATGPAPPDTIQSASELGALPAPLTDEQARALQPLPPATTPRRSVHRQKRPGFYRGAFNQPLTPREVGLREIVYALAANRKQFVHVRLADGKVVTGTIAFADASAFQVQTGIFGNCHSIRYRELTEPPRAVLAIGTRTVRGLETTGLVALCVVALPLALVVYPLIAAGVLRD